jgi:hypothetical protein
MTITGKWCGHSTYGSPDGYHRLCKTTVVSGGTDEQRSTIKELERKAIKKISGGRALFACISVTK